MEISLLVFGLGTSVVIFVAMGMGALIGRDHTLQWLLRAHGAPPFGDCACDMCARSRMMRSHMVVQL